MSEAMPDTAQEPSAGPDAGAKPAPAGSGRTLTGPLRSIRTYLWLAGSVLLLLFPFYLDRFWLQAGLFAMAAAIGAIGINPAAMGL